MKTAMIIASLAMLSFPAFAQEGTAPATAPTAQVAPAKKVDAKAACKGKKGKAHKECMKKEMGK